MTKKLFFDTDCLQSFLWVGRQDIILFRYSGRIVIPQFVYDEFRPLIMTPLRESIDNMIRSRVITKMEIIRGTFEAGFYYELTKEPQNGRVIIGKGEASAIALAKAYNGIVASNNLKDVKTYIDEYELELLTTADILVEAFTDNYITLTEADETWSKMVTRYRRKLPNSSFSEYLRTLKNEC